MTTPAGERILGIDPGLNITGYGVIERGAGNKLKILEAGVIRGGDRTSLAKRLKEIHAGVADVIAQYKPTAIALEELYSHYERPRTAIIMGHARDDMASVYRERVDDERLHAVTDHVRKWLFAAPQKHETAKDEEE